MLKEDYANVKDQVSPCGLHCGKCDVGNGSAAETALNLMNYIQRYELPSWASAVPGGDSIDFKQLDRDLIWISKSFKCPGCLKGGGNPECPIRLCSKEKGLSSCGQCTDIKACTKFSYLGDKGETMKNMLIKGP